MALGLEAPFVKNYDLEGNGSQPSGRNVLILAIGFSFQPTIKNCSLVEQHWLGKRLNLVSFLIEMKMSSFGTCAYSQKCARKVWAVNYFPR